MVDYFILLAVIVVLNVGFFVVMKKPLVDTKACSVIATQWVHTLFNRTFLEAINEKIITPEQQEQLSKLLDKIIKEETRSTDRAGK